MVAIRRRLKRHCPLATLQKQMRCESTSVKHVMVQLFVHSKWSPMPAKRTTIAGVLTVDAKRLACQSASQIKSGACSHYGKRSVTRRRLHGVQPHAAAGIQTSDELCKQSGPSHERRRKEECYLRLTARELVELFHKQDLGSLPFPPTPGPRKSIEAPSA